MNTTPWTPPVSTTPEEYAYNMVAFGTTLVKFPAKTGVELIAEERQRQIEKEGWTPEHDDSHESGEINDAALSYAMVAAKQARGESFEFVHGMNESGEVPWPWGPTFWKPSKNQVHNLVKAGALIAAEIDRLQRAAQKQEDQP